MIKNIFKISILSLITASSLLAVQTKSIDEGLASINLSNNEANILNFPFKIKKASIVSQNPESFQTKPEETSVVVIPSTEKSNEKADLIVTSRDGYTFVINLGATGNEKIFNLTTNKVQSANTEQTQFESGKIDNDIKKLLKSATLDKKIPGYKKMEVKKQFHTPDLLMQKEYILDGGKYRVERWLLKNKSAYDTVVLDPGTFYTNGILAISFEVPKIPAGKIANMWIVINKSSFVETEGGL